MNKEVWLIGASPIGRQHAKVLVDLGINLTVIEKDKTQAAELKAHPNQKIFIGTLGDYLKTTPNVPKYAINAAGIDVLADITIVLISYGIKELLIEKPGGYNVDELEKVSQIAQLHGANVFIAYNRRFYTSTLEAQKIIKEDGGVTSFHFEFTELNHKIEKQDKPAKIKAVMFLGNSTHVVDLAFFLGGKPELLSCYTADETSWHKPSIFTGAGNSDTGALFSYCANWKSPGRWAVEVLTRKRRLIFKPMEKLQVQEIGKMEGEFVDLDYSLDEKYKPGFYLQSKSFLVGDYGRLCTLEEQIFKMKNVYGKMLKS